MALIPTTAQFLAAITGSHQILAHADLWFDGAIVFAGLPIVAGQVTFDDNAAIRTRLTATIADRYGTLLPDLATGGINVYGHELHVRAGIRLPAGGEELLSLGWFRLQQVSAAESFRLESRHPDLWTSGGAVIEVDGWDRAAALEDAAFMAPQQATPGATCLGEIRRLAQGIVPLTTFPPSVPDRPVPPDLIYGDTPLAAIGSLAANLAARTYLDRAGNMSIRPLIDPTGKPADAVITSDAALVGFELVASRDGVYNAVVVRGEAVADAAPIQGIATDANPGSATRWDGPFGRAPTFVTSPLITSQGQADAAAGTALATVLRGRDRTVTVDVIPNPAYEPGSSILQVITPRLSMTGLLTGMTLPLSAGQGPAQLAIRVPQANITITPPQRRRRTGTR